MDDMPPDAPRVVAWLDTDGDNDQLHVRVREGDREYERLDADVESKLGNEQFLHELTQSGLTLLTLRDRVLEAANGAETAPVEVE